MGIWGAMWAKWESREHKGKDEKVSSWFLHHGNNCLRDPNGSPFPVSRRTLEGNLVDSDFRGFHSYVVP